MTTSILYIPASGDPHGVLADGLCGGQMPKVTHDDNCRHWRVDQGVCPRGHWAFPLVWRGDVVPEAEDRLRRRLCAKGIQADGRRLATIAVVGAPHAVCKAAGDAHLWALATIAARELGGRVEVVS